MIAAARIARRLGTICLGLVIWPFLLPLGLKRIARKAIKPVALWWTVRELRRAEERADHFYMMRVQSVPLEQAERKRTVELTARRNQIQGW